jgi:phytoene synthase
MMPCTLSESYAHCAQVAKTEARNFYYSFVVLPPEKKAAMCAIYAFMRYSDDLSDDEALHNGRGERLERWRSALDLALSGEYGDSRILPAFHDTVKRYGIPHHLFHELIDGASMDLTLTRYESFDELYRYCYRVASVVGLVCIHVWGFSGDPYPPAEACGLAFQLTNILRDVKEDAERGRIYLPLEDLGRFGVTEQELLSGEPGSGFRSLMQFEAGRARSYYQQALPLIPMLSHEGRATFVIMYRIYRGLLEQIERSNYDVFRTRAQLSSTRKLGIVAGALVGSRVPGAGRLLQMG